MFKLAPPVAALALLLTSGCVGAKKYKSLETSYNQLIEDHHQLKDRTDALSSQLTNARDTSIELNAENQELAADKQALQADKAEMQRAIAALRANQQNADARVAAYRDLVSRFADMIDAGTLKVTVVDGRMVVQLPTDILFPSGSAQLSADGKKQLEEVGAVLTQIDRDFQIEGHTDSDPIHTERFPSNWELASGRAITVLDVLEGAGVSRTKLSVAGLADTHPVASNDTKEGKAENRRIEIVLRPDLRLMPGFDELERASDATAMADDAK